MGDLVNFLYNWQQLIGALVGAVVAIGGSVLLSNYLTKKSERKRQYSNLLLVLQDINAFISRCESYLIIKNEGRVSFTNVVINDKIDYMGSSQVFDLNPLVYGSIQRLYNIAQVIRYNFEHSEVVTTIVEKSENKETHTQDNVLSGRYHQTLTLVQYFLRDVYKEFNFVAKEVRNLPKEYGYLSFPKSIEFYKKDYVEQKIKEYGLDKVR